MNFLGHAFLSGEDSGILTGNLMGDYVKGLKVLAEFPLSVKNGVLLHRKIDAFTDGHPAVLKARNIFRPDYRLYSGAFVDALFDHFLANDPRYFPSEQGLLDFSHKVYARIDELKPVYPPGFARMFPYLVAQNWLYGYRSLKGIRQAFGGLVRRARYLTEWDRAYQSSVRYYYEFNQLYFDFIDDMTEYAKNELNDLKTGRRV